MRAREHHRVVQHLEADGALVIFQQLGICLQRLLLQAAAPPRLASGTAVIENLLGGFSQTQG